MKRILVFIFTFLCFVFFSSVTFAQDLSVLSPSVVYFDEIFLGENGSYSFDASAILEQDVGVLDDFNEILSVLQGNDPNRVGLVTFQGFKKNQTSIFAAEVAFLSFDKVGYSVYNSGNTSDGPILCLSAKNRKAVKFSGFNSPQNRFIKAISLTTAAYVYKPSKNQPMLFLYNPFGISLDSRVYQTTDISAVNPVYGSLYHTLTIDYSYENGEKAADSYSQQYANGAPFSVNSPQIVGYLPNKEIPVKE